MGKQNQRGGNDGSGGDGSGGNATVASQFQQAVMAFQGGQAARAEALCQAVLAADPRHADALHLLGFLALQAGNLSQAADLLGQSLAINPAQPSVAFSRGIAFLNLRMPAEAIECFELALRFQPRFVEAHNNRGIALLDLKRNADALAAFDAALALQPAYAEAHNNRGNALAYLDRHGEAAEAYSRAIEQRHGYVEAWDNRGVALQRLGRYEAALADFDRALSLAPDFAESVFNRASVLLDLKRPAEAIPVFEHLLSMAPEFPYARAKLAHARRQCCDWSAFMEDTGWVAEGVMTRGEVVSPFAFLAMSASAQAQLQCGRNYVAERCPEAPQPLWIGQRQNHERLRIGYVSADFREHAVSYLMAGIFEQHDRRRFETLAISLAPPSDTAMGRRVAAAFDRFEDLSGRAEAEVASRMRELEIDIAIDLQGYTQNCRPGIFARRPAPVQVNYLGFPGTMGADYMDYLIADRFVVPPQSEQFYAEKIVWMPDCFQANDRLRRIGTCEGGRAAHGLPGEGLVFCAFNNSFKLGPPVFDVWMRLLAAAPGSVLWLVADNAAVKENLRREAVVRGIDPDRLVFAGRVGYADHLARLALADLFLDCLPFNGGTTASDALWAGVPVVTCTGEAFAARMAGSLLHAVGLPELITGSLQDYEAWLLSLVRTPHAIADLKAKLARNRETFPLFDTERFCRHLEAAYGMMWERRQAGLPPTKLVVPSA